MTLTVADLGIRLSGGGGGGGGYRFVGPPPHQQGVMEERCKLPHRGLGLKLSHSTLQTPPKN